MKHEFTVEFTTAIDMCLIEMSNVLIEQCMRHLNGLETEPIEKTNKMAAAMKNLYEYAVQRFERDGVILEIKNEAFIRGVSETSFEKTVKRLEKTKTILERKR